jgi:hypothetical protein
MTWVPPLVALLIIAITFVTDPKWRFSKPMKVDPSRIKDALTLMKDWASWMAGIQTATLGALGYVIQDGVDERLVLPTVCVATFMGAALFSSSYVLASIPSVLLRIDCDSVASERFDVYEMPLFNWTRKVTLGYVAALQHVFWVLGLLSAAWYFSDAIRVVDHG